MNQWQKFKRDTNCRRLENLEARAMLTSMNTFAGEVLPIETEDVVSYRTEDLDSDGLLEVATLHSSRISLFDKPTAAAAFTHRQSFELDARYFDLVDVDGDEKLDLVFAGLSDGVHWLRNTGLGEFDSQTRKVVSAAGPGEFVAADTDNDGDQDLLVPVRGGAILHMDNFDGTGQFRLKEQIVVEGDTGTPSIGVGQIDGDTAVDLFVATSAGLSWRSNVVGYFEVPGPQYKPSNVSALRPKLVDIDRDGDLDAVVRRASSFGSELVWFENHDSRFQTEHVIGTENSKVTEAFFVGDVDHNGTQDVVSRQSFSQSNTIVVYANIGDGRFRGQLLNGSDLQLVGIGDSDDDSQLDVLAMRTDGQFWVFDHRLIGDSDRDGMFSTSDLVAVFQAAQYDDEIDGNSTYRDGDWNGDRDFDSGDFVFAFQAGTFNQVNYPRIFFTKDDIPKLREKLANPLRQSQFDRERQLAENKVDRDYSDRTLYERDKAREGQRFAFLTLMLEHDDPRRAVYAQKARDVLANANEGRWQAFGRFPERQSTFDLSDALHPWYTGETIMNLTLTYDWLMGAGELSGIAQQDARFRILRLTQMEHIQQKTPYDEFNHRKYAIRLANYTFRSVSGVGFASVAFPDQKGLIYDPYDRLEPEHKTEFDTSESLQWVLDELFTEITTARASAPAGGQSLVEHFISADGFIREGFTYEIDTYGVLIPFLAAVDNLTGVDYLSSNGPTDGRILAAFDTNIKVKMPNGTRPLIGDAYLEYYYLWHEIAAAYTDDPGAHFIEAGTVTTNFGISLPYYDDTVPRVTRTHRTEFLTDAGLAVFRDKWGSDATYLMLVAQDYAVLGHDQADQASIYLDAYGTPLVMETGYGSAYNRDPDERVGGKKHWIKSSLGHSTMTIDSIYRVNETPEVDLLRQGVTPTVAFSYTEVPDPARLENTLAARDIDYAEAHVEYKAKEANLVRAVVFPRHRYFILEDTMTSNESHEYGWQLHLGKADSGEFSGSDGKYIWTTPSVLSSQRPDVSLGIYMLDDEGRNVNVYHDGPTNRTGYSYPKDVYDHTYILADKTAEDVKLVTILDPFDDESDKLEVVTLVEGKVWKVIHSPTSYDLILSQNEPTEIHFGQIRTDAQFLVASVDTVNGQDQLISVLARGGTELQIAYEQQQIFAMSGNAPFHFEAPG